MLQKMLSVRLPRELEDRLRELSRTTGRTLSFYVRYALEKNFDDIEHRHRKHKVNRVVKGVLTVAERQKR